MVFEGPEDYHDRHQRPRAGDRREHDPVHPQRRLRRLSRLGRGGEHAAARRADPGQGINHLPTVGDGRQSGTSESPSILNASPESVVGGGLAYLRTGDRVRLDLNASTMDALVDDAEWQARKSAWTPPEIVSQTPWQEIYRTHVGQLADGGCLELATAYHRVAPRPAARQPLTDGRDRHDRTDHHHHRRGQRRRAGDREGLSSGGLARRPRRPPGRSAGRDRRGDTRPRCRCPAT